MPDIKSPPNSTINLYGELKRRQPGSENRTLHNHETLCKEEWKALYPPIFTNATNKCGRYYVPIKQYRAYKYSKAFQELPLTSQLEILKIKQ